MHSCVVVYDASNERLFFNGNEEAESAKEGPRRCPENDVGDADDARDNQLIVVTWSIGWFVGWFVGGGAWWMDKRAWAPLTW